MTVIEHKTLVLCALETRKHLDRKLPHAWMDVLDLETATGLSFVQVVDAVRDLIPAREVEAQMMPAGKGQKLVYRMVK